MRLQPTICLLILSIAVASPSFAGDQIINSGYLSDADATRDLRPGDLIYVTGGIECVTAGDSDSRCVKDIGFTNSVSVVVHARAISGALAEYITEHCSNHKLSTRSSDCFFDIIFKLNHKSVFPTGSMITYEADNIELLKSIK